jgi:hypothetical protein
MRGLTVWALVAAALLSACTTSTTESTTTPTTLAVDLLREAKFTARAVEDIVDAVGTETVQLRDVNFYPQYLIVELQDPEIPEHIDEYEWRNGSVEPPEPVQLTGPQEAIEAELFPSTAVDWRTLPQRVREAEAAAEANRPLRVEDARGQYLFVERSTSPELDGRVILRIYLQGPRRGGYVEMTSSGEILSVIVG